MNALRIKTITIENNLSRGIKFWTRRNTASQTVLAHDILMNFRCSLVARNLFTPTVSRSNRSFRNYNNRVARTNRQIRKWKKEKTRSRRRGGRKIGYSSDLRFIIIRMYFFFFFFVLVLHAPRRQARDGGKLFPAPRSAVPASRIKRETSPNFFFLLKSRNSPTSLYTPACFFDSRRSLSAVPSWRWTTLPAYFTYLCWDSSWRSPWRCSSSAIGRIRIKPTPK